MRSLLCGWRISPLQSLMFPRNLREVKLSLAQSEEEAAQSVEGGYTACFERVKAVGFDIDAHDFASYYADLAKQMG